MYLRLILFLSILMVAGGCDSAGNELMEHLTGDAPAEDTTGSPSGGGAAAGSEGNAVRAAVEDAATRYVREQTDVKEFSVRVEEVAEGWARVQVVPEGDTTDPAVLFLRRTDTGEWRGVAIGTAFAPFDLDDLGVPPAVRR